MNTSEIALEIITHDDVNENYAFEFNVGRASTVDYVLSDTRTIQFTQLHLPGGYRAILNETQNIIIIKSDESTVVTIRWNDAAVYFLRNLENISAAKALSFDESQAVSI